MDDSQQLLAINYEHIDISKIEPDDITQIIKNHESEIENYWKEDLDNPDKHGNSATTNFFGTTMIGTVALIVGHSIQKYGLIFTVVGLCFGCLTSHVNSVLITPAMDAAQFSSGKPITDLPDIASEAAKTTNKKKISKLLCNILLILVFLDLGSVTHGRIDLLGEVLPLMMADAFGQKAESEQTTLKIVYYIITIAAAIIIPSIPVYYNISEKRLTTISMMNMSFLVAILFTLFITSFFSIFNTSNISIPFLPPKEIKIFDAAEFLGGCIFAFGMVTCYPEIRNKMKHPTSAYKVCAVGHLITLTVYIVMGCMVCPAIMNIPKQEILYTFSRSANDTIAYQLPSKNRFLAWCYYIALAVYGLTNSLYFGSLLVSYILGQIPPSYLKYRRSYGLAITLVYGLFSPILGFGMNYIQSFAGLIIGGFITFLAPSAFIIIYNKSIYRLLTSHKDTTLSSWFTYTVLLVNGVGMVLCSYCVIIMILYIKDDTVLYTPTYLVAKPA